MNNLSTIKEETGISKTVPDEQLDEGSSSNNNSSNNNSSNNNSSNNNSSNNNSSNNNSSNNNSSNNNSSNNNSSNNNSSNNNSSNNNSSNNNSSNNNSSNNNSSNNNSSNNNSSNNNSHNILLPDKGLYPFLGDPEFQKKITLKKEFNYKYNIKSTCGGDGNFNLQPHQEFVKKFIHNLTPYNGLLLYHGLGSGKTCSAIGISEEYRQRYKHDNTFKKIIIVASPNVLSNFRLQLFNPSKLKKVGNKWDIKGCINNSLLNELNISGDMDEKSIIKLVNKLIRKYYVFYGYITFSNIIESFGKNILELKKEFSDRMIILDEAHNIRTLSDSTGEQKSTDKKVYMHIKHLVKHVKGNKLIFLTGTPMYNNAMEIIPLLSILRMNDGRPPIKKSDIFIQNTGDLKPEGIDKLKQMAAGYVSYVRGENPETFPHLIMPEVFDKTHSLKTLGTYPRQTFNFKPLTTPIEHLDLYLTPISDFQKECYYMQLDDIKKDLEGKYSDIDSLSYTKLTMPLQLLNMSYPTRKYGNTGFKSIMRKINTQSYAYREGYEDAFKPENIGTYSRKIKKIVDSVVDSEGIALIYSQWIWAGVVPMACALEEAGFKRFEGVNIISSTSSKTKNTYAIICGLHDLTVNINNTIKALTTDNTNGDRIKVVIVSETGTEGLDLNNIRQVHIMEPWYNMSRIEQIIGRAKRNCSHHKLDIKKRNVCVYLHSYTMDDVETLDMSVYRKAEQRAIDIGKVNSYIKRGICRLSPG